MIELKRIIKQYPECLDSANKFKNVLSDFYPSSKDKLYLKILSDILDLGVVTEIRNFAEIEDTSFAYLCVKIKDNYGYDMSIIKECLLIWFAAFDKKVKLSETTQHTKTKGEGNKNRTTLNSSNNKTKPSVSSVQKSQKNIIHSSSNNNSSSTKTYRNKQNNAQINKANESETVRAGYVSINGSKPVYAGSVGEQPYAYAGSMSTSRTRHKTRSYLDSNPLVIVLAIIAILGGFLMFTNVSWLPLVVCLGLGVATEIIALVKGGTEFNKFWIVLFWILSIATMITIISLTEKAFSGFGQQREAVKIGALSEQYYQNNVREIRIFLILIAIIQVGFGAFFGYKYRDNEFVLGMIPVLMIIVFVFICFVFSINNNIFKFITETPASWHKRDFWGYFWDLLLIGVISIIFHGLCTLELNAVSD